MSKAGELNWDTLYKTGMVNGDPEKNRENLLKANGLSDGSLDKDEQFKSLLKSALSMNPSLLPPGQRQPTTADIEDLFKAMGLIVAKEDLEKKEEEWRNRIRDFYLAAKMPVDKKLEKSDLQVDDWGNGKSFNDSLSEEERLARNSSIDGDESVGE